ncbi:MAG: hypothetical protein CFE33_18335 [Pseudorhodobacter sp. PARRP1]|nr:MAG: hypothetical protein CFE33_18335 [Pseudorhodobacter sp. PARRP1]
MKTTIAVLAATTALGAIIAIPGIAMIRTPDAGSPRTSFSAPADTMQDGTVLLASGDDEDNDEGTNDCDEDEGDDDAGTCAAGPNPAPAGTVAPPANGLFGNGAAPQVQVN